MQIIARQFNLSETIFVHRPDEPQNSARVRIFFPTAEISFAGHPTIGCALHLSGGQDGRVALETLEGLVPVSITGGMAELRTPRLPTRHPGQAEVAMAAAALGLPVASIGFCGHSLGIWQGGPAFLFVPLASLADLAQARPVEPVWSGLMAAARVDSAYLYTRTPEGFRARMFSPAAGIPEDPATGSASALLSAQLLAAGELAEGETRIALQQGVEMGRPSQIGLTTVVENGALAQIRVSGRAVKVAEGRIAIPQQG